MLLTTQSQFCKSPTSLSLFLRQIYFSAPQQLGATQVLPIIFPTASPTLAYFFQFKDNHIYNFEYSDTFIEELIEKGYILEVSAKTGKPDYCLDEISETSSVDSRQSIYSGQELKKRHLEGRMGKVKSVSCSEFDHIIYYPILERGLKHRVKAIIEVSYKKVATVPSQIVNPNIKLFLDQFTH